MFGAFKKIKPIEPRVTPEDKEWIEKNFHWFIETFGLEKLIREPFSENFPYTDLNDPDQFQKLFEQLCYWDVDPNEIQVKFFDDIKSKQWNSLFPVGEFKSVAGLYNQVYTTEQKRFRIQLAKSNLNQPQLLVAVLSHELGHVKLLGGNYMTKMTPISSHLPISQISILDLGFLWRIPVKHEIKIGWEDWLFAEPSD